MLSFLPYETDTSPCPRAQGMVKALIAYLGSDVNQKSPFLEVQVDV